MKERIDAWLANNGGNQPFMLKVRVAVGDEFDSTMSYLTEVVDIPKSSIEISQANPSEVILLIDCLPF